MEPVKPLLESPKKLFGLDKPKLLIGGGILAVIIIGSGAYYLFAANRQPAAVSTVPVVTQQSSLPEKTTIPPKESTVSLGAITWFDSPIVLSDLDLFSPSAQDEQDFPITGASYYKVGNAGTQDIVVAVVQLNQPGSPPIGLFIKTDDSHYTVLKKDSADFYDQDGKQAVPSFATNVSVDTTTAIADLTYHSSVTVNGQSVTNDNKYYEFFPQLTSYQNQPLTEYATVSSGKLFIRVLGVGDGFGVQYYVLRLPSFASLGYQLRPTIMGDDAIPQITWNNGAANKDTYRYDGIGSCGSAAGVAVLNTTSLDGLTKSGTAKDGSPIYEYTSVNNETLKYFYNQTERTISIESYKAKHGVFIWRDALGRLVVFSSTVYGSAAECGKPVVYLYPTVPSKVSVQVRATITKSEPNYGSGWNVLALPTGQLFTTNGKQYKSLFWEGTGQQYPAVTSGSVIAQTDLAQVLPAQLKELGLNKQEASDFLDFWLPKLPSTPFVRVTWFGTQQMNQLAPLTITPKPDTLIRIFMDFEGLNQPIAITSQSLSSPARQGFTVVEWGGLLRGNTVK